MHSGLLLRSNDMETGMKRITVSMTSSEKELLSQIADYEGRLSLTATIRHIILEAGRDRNLHIVMANSQKDKADSSIERVV